MATHKPTQYECPLYKCEPSIGDEKGCKKTLKLPKRPRRRAYIRDDFLMLMRQVPYNEGKESQVKMEITAVVEVSLEGFALGEEEYPEAVAELYFSDLLEESELVKGVTKIAVREIR